MRRTIAALLFVCIREDDKVLFESTPEQYFKNMVDLGRRLDFNVDWTRERGDVDRER